MVGVIRAVHSVRAFTKKQEFVSRATDVCRKDTVPCEVLMPHLSFNDKILR